MRNATISRRVTFALVAIGALALANTGALVMAVQASASARSDLGRFADVAGKFQLINDQFALQRSIQAEYAFTGDATMLEDFEASAEIAFGTIDEIVADFSDIAGVEELATTIADLDTIHDEAFFAELPPAVEAGDDGAATVALDHSIENLGNLVAATSDFYSLIDGERLAVEQRLDGVLSTARTAAMGLAALTLLGVAIGVVSTRRATAPISEVATAANRLALGDTDIRLPENAVGEVAQMIDAFGSVVDYLDGATQLAEGIAAGDLSQDFTPKSDQDRLGHSLASMTSSLSDMVRRIQDLAGAVAGSSGSVAEASNESTQVAFEVAQSITTVANGANQQAHILEGLIGSVSAIVEEIAETAESARQATEASQVARGEAESGSRLVDGVSETMAAITEAFDDVAGSVERLHRQFAQVEEIVELIAAIAGQTNLLALNAAIEAARAGELGRGFAVVATEVKALAEESSASTGKIADIVASMKTGVAEAVAVSATGRDRVEQGAQVVASTGAAFRTIAASIEGIDTTSRRVESASSRIEGRSDQIARGAEELGDVSHSNSAAAEQVAAASEQASAAAEEMGARAAELAEAAAELQSLAVRFRLR